MWKVIANEATTSSVNFTRFTEISLFGVLYGNDRENRLNQNHSFYKQNYGTWKSKTWEVWYEEFVVSWNWIFENVIYKMKKKQNGLIFSESKYIKCVKNTILHKDTIRAQMRIQNPTKHLRWSLLQKSLMISSPLMFHWILNTRLGLTHGVQSIKRHWSRNWKKERRQLSNLTINFVKSQRKSEKTLPSLFHTLWNTVFQWDVMHAK